MAGGFHYYFDAARALWEMPSGELYSLARGESDAMQRAAELTLRLKAEYVTPESFRDERSVLAKLASALSEDPEFSFDLALQLGEGRSGPTSVPEEIQWVTRRSRKSVMLWVAIVAAVTLLLLDVLATAGVPVPTPIGDLLDRVTGDDVAPATPAPSPPSGAGRNMGPRPPVAAVNVRPTPQVIAKITRAADRPEANTNGDKQVKDRNLNYANGRERHFANGLVRNADRLPIAARDTARSRNAAWTYPARQADRSVKKEAKKDKEKKR